MQGMQVVSSRQVWIDWLRVFALFMVLVVHCTEPFYFGGKGTLILTSADAWSVAIIDSVVRACVPLFIVASSYLQFPLHYSTGEFFRRRAIRVLIPFVIWSLVYACAWGDTAENLGSLCLNFNYVAGHLWFVYMLLGIYLLMPLLSPWAAKVSKKELQCYLGLCLLAGLVPVLRGWLSADVPVIYGPTGIPNTAKYPLWGEASWNSYGLFYYFSGFIGYLLLGLYVRRFVGVLSWAKTLAVTIPCLLGGFAICATGFICHVNISAQGIFPVEGDVAMGAIWESALLYESLGVMLMTIGWLLLFRKITSDGKVYKKLLLPVSQASYGMYLCHMLILVPVVGIVRESLGSGDSGILGNLTTPVEILISACLSFVLTAIVCVLIRKLPFVGKWIMG